MAKVIAHSEVMGNGSWALYDDGTIYFRGNSKLEKKGRLSDQSYLLYQQQIKRIEVYDFDTIDFNQFEELPNLEEVVIGRDICDIYSEAFYGCHKLQTVIFEDEDIEIQPDAFDNTPYGGFDEAAWEECDDSKAEEFWREMEKCLATLKEPYQNDRQFQPAMDLLKAGAEEGDPELMFLWAEFLNWGRPELTWAYGSGYDKTVQKLADDSMYEQDCQHWYTRSAEAGYGPAICWLGWDALHGIGRRPDPEEARRWFDLAKERIIFSLEPDGLDLFVTTASNLEDDAHWADIDEDDNCWNEYWSRPNPTWRDLHGSALAVFELGRMFGCARCGLPEREHLVYRYGYDRYSGMDRLVL